MLAAFRTHDLDLAVFVHVLGAMVLVGGLVTAATAAVVGWRDGSPRLLRFSSLTLFAIALPGWIVMRIGAEWAYSKESLDKLPNAPTWLDIGFSASDIGGLLLVIALVLGGIGIRRSSMGLLRASGVISILLVALYLVAVWAMGGKPA
jgi:hypothetical protein